MRAAALTGSATASRRRSQEIGDRLHLSRERVRQIETRAKEKLRRSAKLRSHLNWRSTAGCRVRCATTPAGSLLNDSTALAGSCGAIAGATGRPASGCADANIPKRYSALHLRELHGLQRSRSSARRSRRPRDVADSVSDGDGGLFLEGQPGVGKTHLAVAVLKQVIERVGRARPVLRHARPAARHPQHLRPVDPHDRTRNPAAGDAPPICSSSTTSAPKRRPSGSRRR